MKYLLFLFGLTLMSISTFGQADLIDLQITFESAVKSPERDIYTRFLGDFSIEENDSGYIAISNTQNYVGEKMEEQWQQQLSKNMQKKIETFLERLNEIPFDVAPKSYRNDQYTVNYKGKTWNISPNTNLFGYDKKNENRLEYPILVFYATIFKTEIETLYEKRLEHKKRVDQQITQKWYFNPKSHKGLKRGDKLTFSSKPTTETTAYWQINEDFSIKHSLIKHLDKGARVDIEYDLNFYNNKFMYLTTPHFDDFVERIETDRVTANTSFYIVTLNTNELILQIAY